MRARLRRRAMALALATSAVVAPAWRGAYAWKPIPTPTRIEVRACTPEQERHWRFVREAQLGVEARALDGREWVGLAPATDGFHDWAPLDAFKTAICGELSRFGVFEPNRLNEWLRFLPEIPEHDWNLILVPTANSVFDERFRLAQRLVERGHEGDVETCDARSPCPPGERCEPRPCFEAEVTPAPALLKANAASEWLSNARRGQTVCTFGPWVGDGGHGFRPEIHPAERIWWCDGQRLKLLVVQDASQRFADHRQFVWGVSSEPKQWQPWAAPGLRGEFLLTFELARGAAVEFQVDQSLARNTSTFPEAIRDTVPVFTLTQGGSEIGLVRVGLGVAASAEQLQLDLSRLALGPVEVCARRDGMLQGYLRLLDGVGYRYQDGEGYDGFDVLDAHGRCSETPAPAAAEAASSEPGTLQVTVRIAASELDAFPEADRLRGRADRPLAGPAPPGPVFAALLEAATEREPGQLLAYAPSDEVPLPDLRVDSTRRFRLSVRPHYHGPREDRLEDAVDHHDQGELRRLLDAAVAPVPTKVQWSITLRDVSDPGATGEMTADCRPGTRRRLMENDECEITVPANIPSTHVVRVKATAGLLDDSGQPIPAETRVGRVAGAGRRSPASPARQEIRLASHFIHCSEEKERDGLLSWLAATFAGGTASPLPSLLEVARAQQEPPPDAGDSLATRRGYYARMLRHGIALASADGRVTLDELSQFIDMTIGYANPPELTRVPTRARAK